MPLELSLPSALQMLHTRTPQQHALQSWKVLRNRMLLVLNAFDRVYILIYFHPIEGNFKALGYINSAHLVCLLTRGCLLWISGETTISLISISLRSSCRYSGHASSNMQQAILIQFSSFSLPPHLIIVRHVPADNRKAQGQQHH